MFVRPFALTMRLAANMTGGHIAILAILSFVFIFAEQFGARSAGIGVGVVLAAAGGGDLGARDHRRAGSGVRVHAADGRVHRHGHSRSSLSFRRVPAGPARRTEETGWKVFALAYMGAGIGLGLAVIGAGLGIGRLAARCGRSDRPSAERGRADHRRGQPAAVPARRRGDSRRSVRAAHRAADERVRGHASDDAVTEDVSMNNPLVQPDPGLYIWTILTSWPAAGALKKFAWRPLLAALEARQDAIRQVARRCAAGEAGARAAARRVGADPRRGAQRGRGDHLARRGTTPTASARS